MPGDAAPGVEMPGDAAAPGRGDGGGHGPGSRADAPDPVLDSRAVSLAALLAADGERPRTDAELAEAAGIDPGDAGRALAALERAGRAVRVAKTLHFAPEALDALVARIVAICERDGFATIAGVRDELATSRKYAQALLEHLDATKVTIRRGDAHVLRRSAHRDPH
jgi:selenocysteine-specific elongation factor